MDLTGYMEGMLSFARENPPVLAVLALVLLFFVYRKPKLFFGIVGIALLLAVFYYLVMDVAYQGSERKKALIHKIEQEPNP